jgi:hypothetical protein
MEDIHVDAIDPGSLDEWDALARPHTFYASASWLRFVDGDGKAQPRCVVTRADDRTVAALVSHRNPDENHGAYRPANVLPSAVGDDIDLTLGGRRGFRSSVLVPDHTDESAKRIERLITVARERLGGTRWWWPYLDQANATFLMRAVQSASPGFHLVDAECVVDLVGSCTDDLIDSLPGSDRRNAMRRERRRFQRTGMHLNRLRLADCWQALVPLLANIGRKYGSPQDDDAVAATLERQVKALDHCGVVFTCNDGDNLVGFSVGYEFGDELAMRLVGFDYDRLRGVGDEYTQLLVHEPLRYCYERGLRRLHLGADAYAAKVRRGARIVPLWAVVPGMTPDLAAIDAEAGRMAAATPNREAQAFRQEVATAVAGWRSDTPPVGG